MAIVQMLLTVIKLQPLSLSAASFHAGDPQGTVVGTIAGASPGSRIAFDTLSTAGALQINGTSLQVGPTPSGAPATVTFNLVETLSGATNTPNQTIGFSVSELAAIPVNTVVPTITGTAQVGQPLTASRGTWTNTPTSYTYQWNSSAGGAISGATAASYVPVSGDSGNRLTVSVVATNAAGSGAPATSAATSAVAAAGRVPVNTVLPTISGTPQVGQTLTATNGTWTNNPTSFTYQWNRVGTAIGGATASTYVPVSADVGNTLTVSVTAANGSGSSSPATSVATGSVVGGSAPVNTVLPIVTGKEQVGQTLTATNGTWANSPTSFAYQWVSTASGAISGATAATYVPVAADVGNIITVSVTAINAVGSAMALSHWVAPISAAGVSVPVCSANPALSTMAPQAGAVITVTTGTWINAPASFAYQWELASTGAAISGATAPSYTPVAGDVGKAIACKVTASNGAGPGLTAFSPPTSAVIAGRGGVAISGIAQVGQTLTASGGSGAYQWYREGSAISGATSSTYILQPGDISDLIQVSAGGVFSTLAGPVIGTTAFYVSSSTGNDSWTGTSPAFVSGTTGPWATIAKVNGASLSAGTSVLFKRGDTWRVHNATGGDQQLQPQSGASGAGNQIVYDAYGTGANPRILGSFSAATTGAWTNTSGNIWKSIQTFAPTGGTNGQPFNDANDVGNILWGTYPGSVSTGVTSVANRSIGTTTSQSDANLTAQGQWYFNISDWTVRVYSTTNPATAMSGLELIIDKVGIHGGAVSNCIIQNITILYFGGSAILCTGAMTNVTFRDLTIAYIGGGNLGGNGVRFGDGFDIEGGATNVLVERCWIEQMYDGGLTLQPQGTSQTLTGITWRNNVLWHTTQGAFDLFTNVSSNVVQNVFMYNNTIDNSIGWSEGQRWAQDGSSEDGQSFGLWIPNDPGTLSGSISLLNNALTKLGGCAFHLPATFTSYQGVLAPDYNLWNAQVGAPQVCAVGGNESLATWAANYSPMAEVHGQISVAPGFTNAAAGNFVPAGGSNLLNAGTNLFASGVVWDFYKKPRPPTGAFTVGAIQ